MHKIELKQIYISIYQINPYLEFNLKHIIDNTFSNFCLDTPSILGYTAVCQRSYNYITTVCPIWEGKCRFIALTKAAIREDEHAIEQTIKSLLSAHAKCGEYFQF